MAPLRTTKQIYLFFSISLLFGAFACHKTIDLSNIHLNVKIERFDKDFDDMANKPFDKHSAYMKKKYGGFYNHFLGLILEDNTINTKDTAYFKLLRQVFQGRPYKDLKHDVDSMYPDMNMQEAGLTDAFKRIKYYFPKKTLPRVYAFFSGFYDQLAVGDDYVAIGLDLFLGKNSRFYPALTKAYPRYLSRNFNPESIAPKVVEGLAREDMFPESDSSKTLLSKMIYNGKIMYFMDQVLPTVPDTTKIGYTGEQLKWCELFQSKIWAYFLEENLLYESDFPKIQKYLGEAPFTPGLGDKNDSAPKLGVWTGWQIVRQYMLKHPEISLEDLMKETDPQKILNDSKYRPK